MFVQLLLQHDAVAEEVSVGADGEDERVVVADGDGGHAAVVRVVDGQAPVVVDADQAGRLERLHADTAVLHAEQRIAAVLAATDARQTSTAVWVSTHRLYCSSALQVGCLPPRRIPQ